LTTTVCAIVPTFNRAAYLPECLESLLGQTRRLDQIIVVNDGSTDNTDEVLHAYVGKAQILTQANAGKSAALNNALSHCSADYVWICDDDDIAQPDACAALAGALDSNPDAGFAYGRYLRFCEVGGERQIVPMSYWPEHHERALFLELLERCFICQFSSMIRHSVYREVGAFDSKQLRSQDYDMILRIARNHSGAFVDKPLFLQRWHSGSRGAAADRFSSDSSATKWLTYDRMIFDRLRGELSLDELTPPFAQSLPATRMQRAALLERACISGRHAMWPECIADLEQACALAPTTPASPDEQEIVKRTLSELECVPFLIDDHRLRQRLQSLLTQSAFGRSIADAFAAPLFWQIQLCATSRQPAALWSRLRFLLALLGPSRVVGRGLTLALRRLLRRNVAS